MADRLVGATLGHHRQHLPLALGQVVERIAGPAAAHERGDHGRVDDQPARGHPADGVAQLVDVGHAFLEQVAGAVGAGVEQFERVARLDVRGEHEDPDGGMGPGEDAGGVEALGRVGRRHPDVDHDGVGRVGVHGSEQCLRVGGAGRDGEAGLAEQERQALAEQGRVVGDRHPQGRPGREHAHNVGERVRGVKSGLPRSGSALENAAQRVAAQLGLRDEPPRDGPCRARAVVAARPARHQHDGRGGWMRDERLGDGEPVVPGKLHVEQHDVRTEVVGRDEGVRAVDGLAHDVEPVGDQQHVGQRPERRVVVDDENPHSHAPMLAAARRTHHRVNPAGNPGAARYWRAVQRRRVPHDRPATEEPGMSAIVTWTRRHRLVAFFGLTFLLSWWSWPFYALGLAPTAFFPCGPLVAALAVIGVTEGRAGYRDLGARMIRWRVGWTWWLVAVGTPLAVLAVAAVANVAIWGAPAPVLATIAWSQIALGAAVRFVNPLDGPLGEEPGWRGYAVPRLQAQHSPLVSGVVLGVLVALWHLPLVASGMLAPVGLPITFAITLVYVWLFNRTGGSVLMTMVFHIAQGTVSYGALGFTGSDAVRMDWLVGVLWFALALAVVLLDRRAWQVAPAAAAAERCAKPAAR